MPPRVVHSKRHGRGPRPFTALSEEPVAPQSDVPVAGLGMDRSRSEASVRELSWASFDAHVQTLARSILRRFAPEVVVGVAHGGVFVGGALASALKADFFPVRISRRSRDPSKRGKRPRLSGTMPAELKGRRVLVVDDNVDTVTTLALLVKESGHEVRTAYDGSAVLEAALDYRPNLVKRQLSFPLSDN